MDSEHLDMRPTCSHVLIQWMCLDHIKLHDNAFPERLASLHLFNCSPKSNKTLLILHALAHSTMNAQQVANYRHSLTEVVISILSSGSEELLWPVAMSLGT